MNRLPPRSLENVMVPVETVVVDHRRMVLFTSGHLASNNAHPVPQEMETPLASILELFLLPEHSRELAALLNDPGTTRFSRNYLTATPPTRAITVSGSLFHPDSAERQWLLTIQDVSSCHAMGKRLGSLEREMEAILLSQAEELEEATASLIETNVALRKEIRDRQTVLEALGESEARFRNLTETTSDFIWQIDDEGLYTYASPKSVKLLGLEPNQIVGTLFFPWRHSSSGEETGKPNSGFSLEYSYVRQDGQEVIVESSGEPIHSKRGEIVGYRGIDRDVTERRVYEIDLKQAKELAETANHAKSEFLANMSHELRTPLHAILSFANYGEKKIESATRSELLRFFQQIATSGMRLIPLINSLLDLAQLEAGRMKYAFRDHDLITEIELAINELTPLAEKKGLEMRIIPPEITTTAFFDQGRIGQVIRNILSNGIKFSDPSTTIRVAFTQHMQSPNRIMLRTTISNRGIEIPEAELAAIFDKFAQSSKTKSGAGGTGLGLAICRQIVEDHRGKIWADTGADGATRFHFTLPLMAKSEKSGIIIDKKNRDPEKCWKNT